MKKELAYIRDRYKKPVIENKNGWYNYNKTQYDEIESKFFRNLGYNFLIERYIDAIIKEYGSAKKFENYIEQSVGKERLRNIIKICLKYYRYKDDFLFYVENPMFALPVEPVKEKNIFIKFMNFFN